MFRIDMSSVARTALWVSSVVSQISAVHTVGAYPLFGRGGTVFRKKKGNDRFVLLFKILIASF